MPAEPSDPKFLPSLSALIYRSASMRAIDDDISRIAKLRGNVLVLGETGTGKELVAHAIHARSSRAKRAMVSVNITSLLSSMWESDFFGTSKGYASGVIERTGFLQRADGGTLFLDEVGDWPIEKQAVLLRPLQDGTFIRQGEKRETQVDIRVVSATNCDVEADIEKGKFRLDLFHRLSTHELRLPPLRDRKEDIEPIAEHFCQLLAAEQDPAGSSISLSPDALRVLQDYAWPGNVRELANVLRKAHARCGGSLILPAHLPDTLLRRRSTVRLQPLMRPPVPQDPQYERLPRSELVREILTQRLAGPRVVTLLQTHRGGGRTLARQLAPLAFGLTPIWLCDYSSETCASEAFYQGLTGQKEIRTPADFSDWISGHARDRGVLVILVGTQGPPERLEEVAGKVRSVLANQPASCFVVIGGERLLRLRNHNRYSWYRLLPASSFVDVPDFGPSEIESLLRARSLPAEWASMYWEATGGHPWLLYELLTKRTAHPAQAHDIIKYHLSLTHKHLRHSEDPQARSVIERLQKGLPVAPLSDSTVRHEPARFAESRLYFDGFLTSNPQTGQTQFRCPAARVVLG